MCIGSPLPIHNPSLERKAGIKHRKETPPMYKQLVPLHIEAIKEQQAKIKQFKEAIGL